MAGTAFFDGRRWKELWNIEQPWRCRWAPNRGAPAAAVTSPSGRILSQLFCNAIIVVTTLDEWTKGCDLQGWLYKRWSITCNCDVWLDLVVFKLLVSCFWLFQSTCVIGFQFRRYIVSRLLASFQVKKILSNSTSVIATLITTCTEVELSSSGSVNIFIVTSVTCWSEEVKWLSFIDRSSKVFTVI